MPFLVADVFRAPKIGIDIPVDIWRAPAISSSHTKYAHGHIYLLAFVSNLGRKMIGHGHE